MSTSKSRAQGKDVRHTPKFAIDALRPPRRSRSVMPRKRPNPQTPRDANPSDGPTLFTIGHSTRTLRELVAILEAFGVVTLADVRTVPRSRRVPWFNAETLGADLARSGIAYVPMTELGGLRKARADSPNTAWRNASFRGYADYMQTPAFEDGLERLIEMASAGPTAVMCAEAVPWRCHRSLIGDAMIARGWRVVDLMGEKTAKPHKLTDFARVEGTRVTYPGEGLFA